MHGGVAGVSGRLLPLCRSMATTVVRARMVRHAPREVGVQFLCVDDAKRKSLADFMQSIPDAQPPRHTLGITPDDRIRSTVLRDSCYSRSRYSPGTSSS